MLFKSINLHSDETRIANSSCPTPATVTSTNEHLPFPTDLVFALAQQLLLAQVVDAQVFADADEDAALERRDGAGHVVRRRLVQQLQLFACDENALHNEQIYHF